MLLQLSLIHIPHNGNPLFALRPEASLTSTSHSSILRRDCAVAGWHGVELRYSKSPLDQTSVFKFFVIDAEQVETVYNSGVPSNQILWKVSPVK